MTVRAFLLATLVLLLVPAALGVLFAFVALVPGALFAVAVLGGLAGALWHAVVSQWPDSPGRWRRWRATARWALAASLGRSSLYGAAALLAVAGTVALAGAGTGLALSALTVTVGGAYCRAASSQHAAAEPPSPEPADEPSDASGEPEDPTEVASARQAWAHEVRDWSDEALCRAWRSSYGRLERSHGLEMARIAREREAYLDELERRNPAGFAAWMASGARAPSNPSRYLTTPRPPARRRPPDSQDAA